MKLLMRLALLLGLTLSLGACMGGGSYVSEPAVLDSGASIQTGVTGGGLRGTEETLVEVNIPGQDPTHMVRSNFGLGREIVRDTVPGVVHTVTGGIVTDVLQGRNSGCQGGSCGTTYVLQGGQAVATSGSTATSGTDTTVTINGTCTNPLADGTCPAMPE